MSLDAVAGAVGEQPNGGTYLDTLFSTGLSDAKSATLQGVNPLTGLSAGSFNFDYEGESSVRVETEITDHYAENNRAIQDHVAIKPTRVTLCGFVSEVVATKSTILGALNAVQTKLTAIPAYLRKYTPGIVQGMQRAITQAENVTKTVNTYLNKIQSLAGPVLSLFTGPTVSKQQKAFAQLSALASPNPPGVPAIFTLTTPFKQFNNMVIEGIVMEQPDETKGWSKVTLTLKQMRFASTTITASPSLSQIAQAQQGALADNGNVTGASSGASSLWNPNGSYLYNFEQQAIR